MPKRTLLLTIDAPGCDHRRMEGITRLVFDGVKRLLEEWPVAGAEKPKLVESGHAGEAPISVIRAVLDGINPIYQNDASAPYALRAAHDAAIALATAHRTTLSSGHAAQFDINQAAALALKYICLSGFPWKSAEELKAEQNQAQLDEADAEPVPTP